MKCNCKFYELDLEAQEEAAKMEILLSKYLSEEELATYSEQVCDETPFSECGEFCKYFKSGKGYPGEYVYHCCAKGNEHIIHIDFNESEII